MNNKYIPHNNCVYNSRGAVKEANKRAFVSVSPAAWQTVSAT